MQGTLKKAGLVVAILGLTACSSMTTVKTENIKEKQVPSWYLDHADKGTESAAWYKPWDRQGYFYAVAEAVSPSMEMALKKATLKAKAKVADRVNGEMNNRSTIKYDEQGQPENPQGYETAQDVHVNLIAETILRTYGVEDKMVVYNPQLRNYRAFVLLKISQSDVQKLAANYDANKQLKLRGRFAGKDVEETAKEVLQQAREQ